MTSRVDIINVALTKLGENRILEIDEGTKQAEETSAVYDSILESELMENRWGFATKRASLAALAEAPEWGYARKFALPADCLSVQYVNGQSLVSLDYMRSSDSTIWKLEGGAILTDLAAPLQIIYTAKIDNPDEWDAGFRKVMSIKIAEIVCVSITNDKSLRDRLTQEYEMSIRTARQQSAIQSPPQDLRDSSWLAARL
jgi:hypothetical protein